MSTGRSTSRRDRDRATIKRGRPDCALCGRPIDYTLPHMDPLAFVVDHVDPIANGGPDHIDNKQAAHRACNRAKGARADGGPVIRRSNTLTRPPG